MKIITRYIVKEIVPNFFVGLLFFTLLMLIQEVFKLVSMAIENHVPIFKTLELFVYVIPYTLALTIPVGVLVGTLLAVGRLSSDIEIIAMRTCGVSLFRIFVPTNIFGIIMAILTVMFFQFVLPWGNYNYVVTRVQIVQQDPTVQLTTNEALTMKSLKIEVGKVDSDTHELLKIRILDSTKDEIIFAPKGRFIRKDIERNAYPLVLFDAVVQTGRYKSPEAKKKKEGNSTQEGFNDRYVQRLVIYVPDVKKHEVIPRGNRIDSISKLYEKMRNDRVQLAVQNIQFNINKMSEIYYFLNLQNVKMPSKEEVFPPVKPQPNKPTAFNIDNENVKMQLVSQQGPQSPPAPIQENPSQPTTAEKLKLSQGQLKLVEQFYDLEGKSYNHINGDIPKAFLEDIYEFHKKFAIPFACLVFTLIGTPLGIFNRRAGKSLGLGVSIIIILCWYGLMFIGNILWKRDYMSPVIGSWLPDIVLAFMGIYFIYKRLTR